MLYSVLLESVVFSGAASEGDSKMLMFGTVVVATTNCVGGGGVVAGGVVDAGVSGSVVVGAATCAGAFPPSSRNSAHAPVMPARRRTIAADVAVIVRMRRRRRRAARAERDPGMGVRDATAARVERPEGLAPRVDRVDRERAFPPRRSRREDVVVAPEGRDARDEREERAIGMGVYRPPGGGSERSQERPRASPSAGALAPCVRRLGLEQLLERVVGRVDRGQTQVEQEVDDLSGGNEVAAPELLQSGVDHRQQLLSHPSPFESVAPGVCRVQRSRRPFHARGSTMTCV